MLYIYIYLYMWHIYVYMNYILYLYIHTDIHTQESPGHVENLCLRPGASVASGPLVIAKPQVKDAASQVTRGVCGGGEEL